MSTSTLQRRPLGQILISEGILSEDQLRIALLEQMKSNQPIGKLLVSLGFVSEATLREAQRNDVVVGAHVAYRDLVGFGRRPMDVAHADLVGDVIYQIGALQGLAAAAGTTVQYVVVDAPR